MLDLLINNAAVVTVDQGRVIERGYLGVRGNSIVALGEGQPPPDLKARRTIEGEGMVAMPGLVNAHTHLAMTLVRGFADDMDLQTWLETKVWPMEAKLSYEDVYWGGMLGIVEMLRSGTTTFNDMYHFFEATAQAIVDSGIRGCPSGVLLGFLPSIEEDIFRAIRFAEEWNGRGNGRVVAMLGPHAPYSCQDDVLAPIVEAAKAGGFRIHIHLCESRQEVEESKRLYGKTPVHKMADLGLFDCGTLAAHCVHLEDADLELLAHHKVGVSHNPGSNMKLAAGFARVPEMLDRGISVGLGTDGAASNNNLDMFEEMRLCALLHKVATGDPTVINAPVALEMATLGSARVLGLEDQVGSLRTGKKADIILLDFSKPHLTPRHNVISHIVYSARAEDVHTVIVDGQVLLENRQFCFLDEAEILTRASERAQILASMI